ncbi:MAG TPA: hypothetical protein VMZ24_00185 [Patescibacteria group bacterium]|nr:hypothetical protein [Patescibacteria group bacterium]
MSEETMYLLIMILDDSTRLNEVLEAWKEVGVPGITILESTGLNRVLPRHTAQPMFAGFSQVFGGGRIGHHTLFAIIDSLELANAAAGASTSILGDLTQPHTAIMCALPIAQTWGVPEQYDGDQ